MPIATTSGAIIPPNAKVLYWRNDGTFDLIEENSIFLYFFPFSVTFILGIWRRNFIFSLVPVDFYILIDFSNWHFYFSNALIGTSKGQLISKCLSGVIVWTKKTNENIVRISALTFFIASLGLLVVNVSRIPPKLVRT